VSLGAILGVVTAVVAVAALAWGVYTWVSERRRKSRAERTQLRIRLTDEPMDIGVDVVNPTDRNVRLRDMRIIGATTGKELAWPYAVPEVIDSRDGYRSRIGLPWLRLQLSADSAVFVKVETSDGETVTSATKDMRAPSTEP
jgi:hypothetical protein